MRALRRGLALASALLVGVLLVAVSACVLGFVLPRHRAQRQVEEHVQAYWNARAGVERYLAGQLPQDTQEFTLKPGQRCRYYWDKDDLVLEGLSGRSVRRLRLPGGRLDGMVEETP